MTAGLLLGATFLAPLPRSFAQPTPAPAPTPAAAFTPSSAAIYINGQQLNLANQPPVSAGGRLLVPLRAIFEALGAKVNYSAGQVNAQRGSTTLQLTLGSTSATVNGQPQTLDVPAQAIDGRTLVPLRFIGESLGANVQFNAATQAVNITAPPATPTAEVTPIPPIFTTPGNQTVSGTLQSVTGRPGTLILNVDGQNKTYLVAENALFLRQVSLAPSLTETPVRQPARQVSANDFITGEAARLTLDANNRVTQILSTATVVTARVQFAGGNQIILDDDRDTTITIDDSIKFIDTLGHPTTAINLQSGQRIALFLSRQSRAIYQVSAYAPDFTPAGDNSGGLDPLPGAGLPANGAPQIQTVIHDATGPLRAGQQLGVTVRATPNQKVSFSLGSRLQNIALTENINQPGLYTTTYTVRPGDDVLDARITARLVGANNFEDIAQSVNPVTIDTKAPRLLSTFPANNSQITIAQPNIVIFAEDLGGSGLAGATIELVSGSANNPTRTPLPATVAPPTSINAVPLQPLSGPVTVRGVVTDRAGNQLSVNFGFTVVNTGTQTITSFAQGANRAMMAGEDVPLSLSATPAGVANFDVLDASGATLQRDLPLTEDTDNPGTYRATYRIPDGTTGSIRFVGKFSPGDNTFTQSEATAPVAIAAPAAPTRLSIDAPRDNDKVVTPVVISGRAAPNAIIDVSLRAEGTQLFIMEYKEELGTIQVRADARGNWQTQGLDLPARRNISDLHYVVTATQTDNANRTSDPVSITVRTK